MNGARSRLDRAVLNLIDLENMLSGEESERLRVFVSRTSCALNTVATELAACIGSTNPHNEVVIAEAANILWSFGEKAALTDRQFGASDDARPKKID